ncbi:SDR family oxidoreductase [Metabacillus malikii]|uniref:NAD(P)-dependent dehydrogenase (Short-subunit alcohol dehydrogenase family) n=1 Tax=Metabacillus malikii TaxID=1504265 RepID=A0ABT9ZJ20_9BACI|nr:SDR family oxidoreductase [Metabacillus malikii]MDQ0232269.1 NAD(P)-dependent dehydrogenase (short-subunit alcohol dehydrogenase family) [Metabacillus malikii]
MANNQKQTLPPQQQDTQPGLESLMNPSPSFYSETYKGSGKLTDKVAIITGGDSGIGRAVAVHFAKEGADVVISYLNEHDDAEKTKQYVEEAGRKCLTIAGDIGDESICKDIVTKTIDTFGKLDIVVNNAAEQHPQKGIEDITSEQLERTFRTNIFSFFYLTKAALPHLKEGSTIINTTSITAYAGNEQLIDYSATKGAITTFTRSLALSLAGKGIRVNGVAPGPIWTPLIPSTFTADQVSSFGSDTPMKRPGQPVELAPAYVYLASNDSSYMTGQILHLNGGKVING